MRTKFRSLRWTAALLAVLAPVASSAATFTLDNINLSDFDSLVNEFSANSQYTSVAPASSLGMWGFEVGVVGGMTKAPDTKALVSRNGGGSFPDLYHAGGLFRLGVPFGITAEGMFLPKIKVSSVKLGRWAIAAQWTMTDNVLDFIKETVPLNIAIKGYYTKTTLDYSQTITNASTANVPVNANIDFGNSLYGFQALTSYKILVFEPFVGIGWTKAKGKLNIDAAGSVTILNTSVFGTAAKSAESSPSSAQILAGTDVQLAFFSLGAEWERAFGKNSYTGRLSFRF